MAADAQLFFLLFALISNIQAEERLKLMGRGGYYTFKPPKEANFCLISKLVGEDKFVLWNTSDPSTENSKVPEDLKQRLQVETWQNVSSYIITELTPSDSGRYQEECWTDGNVTHEANIRIIVCDQQHQIKSVDVSSGGTLEIPCDGAAENLTVQWIYRDMKKDTWTKVFEDDGTLVVNYEKGTLQKMENTSALRVSNFTSNQIGEVFVCLVMNQHQCVSGQILHLNMFPEIIYHSVEETAVLPCPVTDVITDQPPSWKKINYEVFISDHKLQFGNPLEFKDVGQNSSLVISPLMLNHSGWYICSRDIVIQTYLLVVCPESDPPAVELFSEGDEVTLRCNARCRNDSVQMWFMKSKQTEGRIFAISLMIDLQSRFSISSSNRSLVISNVSVENTGEYWCVEIDSVRNLQCVSASRSLVKQREPVEVSSTFLVVRSPLFSVLLLMLCVTVVAVILKTRRGEQPPAETERIYENTPNY